MKSLLILMAFAAVAQGQPKPDFIVGYWRWFDGKVIEFRPDNSFECVVPGNPKGILKGRWDVDPFVEKGRKYGLAWAFGINDDLAMASTLDLIKGTNSKKQPVSASKVDRYTIALWCNDYGVLRVNGQTVINANKFPKTYEGTTFLRAGDVVTVALTNRTGELAMILEMPKNGQRSISATDFKYTLKPAKDWSTSDVLFGYVAPLKETAREMTVGDTTGPVKILPQKQDEKAKTIYLKYVVR